MIYTRHSHCFSKCQLQLIIDDYLTLGPYYRILIQALKSNVQKFQAQATHPKQKAHPIRVFTKDYQCSKNILDNGDSNITEGRMDLRSTYASGSLIYFYLFPLQYIIQILESAQFYKLLPSKLIINGLLTTTNLQIIIQTLKIVSEDMCKKIRSTIAGKELRSTSYPTKDKTIQQQDKCIHKRQPTSEFHFDFESKIEIQVEAQADNYQYGEQAPAIKVTKTACSIPSHLVRKQIMGTNKYINLDRQIAEQSCRFCEGYLIYLYETVGQNPLDTDINHLSAESFRCLNLISKVVPHFTIYLTENNLTHIPNDIYTINKILNSIGLVLTQDIFASELNPRIVKPQGQLPHKPKNLIEELQPYFGILSKKKSPTQDFSVEQLFRMIVYAPTIDEVKDQLKNQQSQEFQKHNILNNFTDDKYEQLLKKQCKDMKQFEAERLTILKHRIETKPVYKIINIEEQIKKNNRSVNNKPTSYNVFNPSKSLTKSSTNNDKPFACQTQNKGQYKVTGKDYIKGDTYKDKKSKKQKENDLSYPEFNAMAMSTVLKKSAIKPTNTTSLCYSPNSPTFFNSTSPTVALNYPTTPSFSNFHNQAQKLMTFSTQCQNQQTKSLFNDLEQQQELTNEQFKKILYNAYSRRNHIIKNQNNYITGNSSPSNTLNSNMAKTQLKKMNSYNSSLSHFIGRKQEQEQMDCIEKQQKQLYNKQLLNGQFIKNEVYEQLRRQEAEVFADYQSVMSLNDTFGLENKFRTLNSKETEQTNRTHQQITFKSSRKKINIIEENSNRYNQSGIIRNEKYSKSIKSELINHRQSFIKQQMAMENKNKNRLIKQIHQRLTQPNKNHQKIVNIKEQYEKQLKIVLDQRNQMNQVEKMFHEHQQSYQHDILL